MDLRASGCYYHPGRLAVATCAKCGVGICRECLVRDENGTILCYRCGNEKLKKKHREYRKTLKESGGRFKNSTEFVIPGMIGILIAAVGVIAIHYGGGMSWSEGAIMPVVASAFFAYMLFSIPFCYVVLSDLFAPKYETLDNHFCKWYLKIGISLFAGWIVFTFILIRFILKKNKP